MKQNYKGGGTLILPLEIDYGLVGHVTFLLSRILFLNSGHALREVALGVGDSKENGRRVGFGHVRFSRLG